MINSFIRKGETILPNFASLCSLVWSENVGFNLLQSQSRQVVHGVREGSSAYEAGLRDGQAFIDWSYENRMVTVVVLDKQGGEQEIRYLQEAIDQRIPQYVLNE